MHYYFAIVAKFAIGFAIILIHMNLSGRTQISQLTPIDFVGNFVLGGVMGGVIYDRDIPMYQYVIVLLIGVAFISILNSLTKRVTAVRSVAVGKPITIIKDGKLLIDDIESNKSRVDLVNIASQIHLGGVKSIQQIHFARIEPSGQLTIFCDKKDLPSSLLIADGKIVHSGLAEIDKDDAWLEAKLKNQGLDRKDVLVAEYWDGKIVFMMKDGSRKEQEVKDVL